MTEINKLLNLCVEMEGLLRVLADRDSEEAKALLDEKYADFAALMGAAPETPKAAPCPAPQADEPVEPAEPVEVVAETIVEAEPEEVPEPAPEPVSEAPKPAAEPARRSRANTLPKAFTLNDKFRFIREVFGGNEDDFNDTVAILADMDSFDDAREYLLSDMMLDPKSPSVAEFLELVERNIGA